MELIKFKKACFAVRGSNFRMCCIPDLFSKLTSYTSFNCKNILILTHSPLHMIIIAVYKSYMYVSPISFFILFTRFYMLKRDCVFVVLSISPQQCHSWRVLYFSYSLLAHTKGLTVAADCSDSVASSPFAI